MAQPHPRLPDTLFDTIIKNVCHSSGDVHCAVDSLLLLPAAALLLACLPWLLADTLNVDHLRRQGYSGSRKATETLPSWLTSSVSFLVALTPLVTVGTW